MLILQLSNSPQFAIVDDEDHALALSHSSKWSLTGPYVQARSLINKRPSQKVLLLHRLVLGLDNKDYQYVDHINGNTLDNRKENLRICSQQGNCRNRTKRKYATSIYKGVNFYARDKKWHSKIKIDGVSTFLGSYLDEVEAAKAYDKAAKEKFGQFAKLNFNYD